MSGSIQFELAPINTGFAKNGVYDQRIIDFHKLRSGNNISISCLGNIATSKTTTTNNSTAYLCKENEKTLKKIASTIKDNGSTAAAQIASRISRIPPKHGWQNQATEHIANATQELNHTSEQLILNEISDITSKAIILARLGFQSIQIHAAHGYFLSRILNRKINKRKDKFSFGNLSWLRDVRDKFAQETVNSNLEIRINLADGTEDYDDEVLYKNDIIREILDCGITKISLSNGFYDINKSYIYPDDKNFALRSLNNAIKIAQDNSPFLFSISGNIFACITPESLIPNNLSIAVGRPLIADPFAIDRFYDGKTTRCIKCGECHYFSNKKEFLSCSQSTSRLSPN